MDREKEDELPKLQLSWIDGICLPLYKVKYNRTTERFIRGYWISLLKRKSLCFLTPGSARLH